MSMTTLILVAGLLSLQDAGAMQADEPQPSFTFPDELVLVPESVQDAAETGEAAEDATVPEGLSPVQEALYRAQLAWMNEDWSSARRYAETAAAAGDTLAATMAGLIAKDGRDGTPRDLGRAVTWFSRAAEDEQPIALYELGRIARNSEWQAQLGAPRLWFERAGRLGHLGSMLALGLDLKDSPLPQDQLGAREWFERAARGGSPEGMYQFAQMLDRGEGGHRDQSLARQWFELAAEERHAEAALQAAIMWAEGDGGEASDSEARRLMRISAESGYAPAQGQYGLMMYQGRGGEADPAMASYWFEQGARGGDAESQFLLAYSLAQGDGRPQDLDRAYYWTLRAEYDPDGAFVENSLRDQMRLALERSLPPADVQRIQGEVSLEP